MGQTTKPPAGTPVNSASGYVVGLLACFHYPPSLAAPVNLANAALSGSFVGAPAFTSDDGGAFVSDNQDGGGSPSGDYHVVPDGGALDWTGGPQSWLLSIVFGAHSGTRVIVARGNYQVGGFEFQAESDFNAGSGELDIEFNHAGGISSGSIASGLHTGLHDICIIADGHGTLTCVVDGAVAGSRSYSAPASDGGANALHVGVNWPVNGADVALRQPLSRYLQWGRALSVAEAVALTLSDRYGYMAAASTQGNPNPPTPPSPNVTVNYTTDASVGFVGVPAGSKLRIQLLDAVGDVLAEYDGAASTTLVTIG